MKAIEEEKVGGSAFPNNGRRGMTLRDYFAGQALAGMGQWTPYPNQFLVSPDGMKARARWAYAQADAMLGMRES